MFSSNLGELQQSEHHFARVTQNLKIMVQLNRWGGGGEGGEVTKERIL